MTKMLVTEMTHNPSSGTCSLSTAFIIRLINAAPEYDCISSLASIVNFELCNAMLAAVCQCHFTAMVLTDWLLLLQGSCPV